MLSFPFALTEVTKTSLTPLRESGEALKTGRPMGKCTIVLWEAPLPSQPSKHTGPNHSPCPGVGTPTPVSCRSRFFSVGSKGGFQFPLLLLFLTRSMLTLLSGQCEAYASVLHTVSPLFLGSPSSPLEFRTLLDDLTG